MNVLKALKQLQADSQVFYFKLHNLHWNVKGMMFEPIHLKTQALYEEFAIAFDDLAERQLQLRETPIVSMKDALEISHIKETPQSSFNANEVLSILIEDLGHFHEEYKNLSGISEGDPTTTSFADDKIAWLEKELWMLRSMLG